MFFRIEPYLALVLLLATTAFAGLKGGAPERLGTAMIVVAWIGTMVAQAVIHAAVPTLPFLFSDVFLAAGFLVVAVRYSSLWLAAAMICEAVAFGAHAMRLSDNTRVFWHGLNVYLMVTNAVSFLVLFVLIGGTCATIQRRRLSDREKVEDRARAVKRPAWLTDAPPPSASIP